MARCLPRRVPCGFASIASRTACPAVRPSLPRIRRTGHARRTAIAGTGCSSSAEPSSSLATGNTAPGRQVSNTIVRNTPHANCTQPSNPDAAPIARGSTLTAPAARCAAAPPATDQREMCSSASRLVRGPKQPIATTTTPIAPAMKMNTPSTP